jgi:hypothetical protein
MMHAAARSRQLGTDCRLHDLRFPPGPYPSATCGEEQWRVRKTTPKGDGFLASHRTQAGDQRGHLITARFLNSWKGSVIRKRRDEILLPRAPHRPPEVLAQSF